MIKKLFGRLLLLPLVGLALALVPTPAYAATHSVTIANFAYSPASMSVQVGDTITWTNKDTAPHDVTVTSGPTSFKSPLMTTGQSWTFTVRTAGSYSYTCSIHPQMRATLQVAAAPVAAAAAPAPAAAPAAAPPVVQAVPPQSAAAAGAQATTAPVAAGAQPSSSVNAKLLIAGLVVAVAVLCLLLLGSHAMTGQALAAARHRPRSTEPPQGDATPEQ